MSEPDIIKPDTNFIPKVNATLEPQIDWANRSIILGRDRQAVKKMGRKGTMQLGVVCEQQNTGASLFGYQVLFDNKFPHIIFVCGKRGSGKSYSLGVIVEELARSDSGIGTIVIDPLGTFWTMKNKNKNKKAEDTLARYGLYPRDFQNIQVLTPVGFYKEMRSSVDSAFSIAVSDLSADDWCLVFNIDRFKTQGLLIGDALDKIERGYHAKVGKATKKIQPERKGYTIGDIIFCIQNEVGISSADEGYAQATKRSVIARFKAAATWGIFSVNGTPLNQISIRNKVTILDVSHSKLGSSRRALLVGILSRKILEARIDASRTEEASEMGLQVAKKDQIPVTWLIIDEAHLLLPSSGKTPASESLVEYAKLGRKPGCGLVLATQRPAATNDDILSQVDTIMGHNLALEDDIAALRRRIPAKIPAEFNNSDFIRSMPVGLCILAEQKTQQRSMLVQIRPRLTHHSGKAAMPKSDEEVNLAAALAGGELPVGTAQEGTKPGSDLDTDISPDMYTEPPDDDLDDQDGTIPEDIMNISIDVDDFETSLTKDDLDSSETFVDHDPNKKGTASLGEALQTEGSGVPERPAPATTKQSAAAPASAGLPVSTVPDTGNVMTNIETGGAYIIISKKPDYGFNIFNEFSKKSPGKNLSFTRTHPSKLNFGILPDDVKKIWLSKSSEKDSVSPGNITQIAHIINEFLKNNDKGVILLDGLEYLINHNDFPKVLRFVESVHEKVVLNKGILFIPVNPAALSKGDLDQLENELANTIIDPLAVEQVSTTMKLDTPDTGEVVASTDVDVAAKPGQPEEPEDAGPGVRTATKDELKRLCEKLGLKTTGTADELKKRLMEYDEGRAEPQELDKTGTKRVGTDKLIGMVRGGAVAGQEGAQPEITASEQRLLDQLAEERKALDALKAEREKVQNELARLRESERKQKMRLERQRLIEERKKLKKEKSELEKIHKKLQQGLSTDKTIKKGTDGSVPKHLKKEITKDRPVKDLKKGGLMVYRDMRGQLKKHEKVPPLYKSIKEKREEVGVDRPRRPGAKPAKRTPREREPEPAGDHLMIRPRLGNDEIEEFAIKQLKTKFLKPIESIRKLQQIYLPLLRVYIKTMRGSLFAKEHDGMFYWDTVTGEVITDFGNGLKRSKGLALLMTLSPKQAKVLAVVGTWGSNDVVDIQNEVNIPANEIKRALTALKKKSLIVAEQHTEKRMYNYKRCVELKFPKKFDKIRVDMPSIVKGALRNDTLTPQYKLSDLKKVLDAILPGTRIITTEEVYYPYYRLDIIGKQGPRAVILDSVRGGKDEALTDFIRLSNKRK